MVHEKNDPRLPNRFIKLKKTLCKYVKQLYKNVKIRNQEKRNILQFLNILYIINVIIFLNGNCWYYIISDKQKYFINFLVYKNTKDCRKYNIFL